MRSFTLVVLCALALAVAAFAPVASADANITLYADMFCSQVLGDGPINIPIPSSPTCQDMSSPTSSGSAVFWCYNAGGYNNFSLNAWTMVSDCSGGADAFITGYGKEDSCVTMSINVGGQSTPAFAKLQCAAASSVEQQREKFQLTDINAALSMAKRAAFVTRGADRMMARMRPHPLRTMRKVDA